MVLPHHKNCRYGLDFCFNCNVVPARTSKYMVIARLEFKTIGIVSSIYVPVTNSNTCAKIPIPKQIPDILDPIFATRIGKFDV